jgi:hypothetical protein
MCTHFDGKDTWCKRQQMTPRVEAEHPIRAPNTPIMYTFDAKKGENLQEQAMRLGGPFSANIDATIDNLRNLGGCEIVIKNNGMASGKLWRALRDELIDNVKVTLK